MTGIAYELLPSYAQARGRPDKNSSTSFSSNDQQIDPPRYLTSSKQIQQVTAVLFAMVVSHLAAVAGGVLLNWSFGDGGHHVLFSM